MHLLSHVSQQLTTYHWQWNEPLCLTFAKAGVQSMNPRTKKNSRLCWAPYFKSTPKSSLKIRSQWNLMSHPKYSGAIKTLHLRINCCTRTLAFVTHYTKNQKTPTTGGITYESLLRLSCYMYLFTWYKPKHSCAAICFNGLLLFLLSFFGLYIKDGCSNGDVIF